MSNHVRRQDVLIVAHSNYDRIALVCSDDGQWGAFDTFGCGMQTIGEVARTWCDHNITWHESEAAARADCDRERTRGYGVGWPDDEERA